MVWTTSLVHPALVHGTATLLLAKGIQEGVSRELRHTCIEGFEALVENAPKRSFRSKRVPLH